MGAIMFIFKFMVFGALSVGLFWFVQIRYGETDDLDRGSWLCRLFARKPEGERATSKTEHIAMSARTSPFARASRKTEDRLEVSLTALDRERLVFQEILDTVMMENVRGQSSTADFRKANNNAKQFELYSSQLAGLMTSPTPKKGAVKYASKYPHNYQYIDRSEEQSTEDWDQSQEVADRESTQVM